MGFEVDEGDHSPATLPLWSRQELLLGACGVGISQWAQGGSGERVDGFGTVFAGIRWVSRG
ncbi:MAG: hypothetical protein K0U98_16475 [Deltaproteobacteria bacterium]|nr:hypothetical protein [Deltaproteobacteria bacterium]